MYYMYGYIYMTTNLVNGKRYIGQHKATVFTEDYKGSGKIIRQALKKYGKENFKVELLEICENIEHLNSRERYWISYYNACWDNNFYNVSNGGGGFGGLPGDKNPAKRLDVREKMSKNHADISGIKNPSSGGLSNEHKRKISETRKKQGIGIGKNNPNYGNHKLKGYKYINNGIISKMVNPNDLDSYLQDDWKIGRLNSDAQRNRNKGRIWINNNVKELHIKPEQLNDYLSIGWNKGRLV